MNKDEKIKDQVPEKDLVLTSGIDSGPVKRIETFKDLLEEEQRLTMKLKREKTTVSAAFFELKAKVEPAAELIHSVNNVFGIKEKPGLVAHGVDMVMDLVSKKYLFKKSSWLITLLGSYAVRGVSQYILRNKKKGNTDDGVLGAGAREAAIREGKKRHNGTDA